MVRIVDRNFYMDDFIKSLSSTAKAKKIFTELVQCLKQRGFELKKWITNNAELNAFIPENLRSSSTIKTFDVEAINYSIFGLKLLTGTSEGNSRHRNTACSVVPCLSSI